MGTTQAIEPVYKRKWFEENLSGQIPVVVPNLSPETWAHYYTPAYEVEQTDIIKAAADKTKVARPRSIYKYLYEPRQSKW